MNRATRVLAWLWASPNTAVGLVVGTLVLLLGGHVRFVRGAIEFSGGLLSRLISRLVSRPIGAAITLGHVILGINREWLDFVREHEQVHVRQYERWGPLFLPAYVLSSLWQFVRGRRAYRDNWFERQAFAAGSAEIARR